MQFPRLHPAFFTPIFLGDRFLAHALFYRIAQFGTLDSDVEINRATSGKVFLS